MLNIGFKTDVGRKRNVNQDTMYISKDSSLPIYLVADGMGGHKAGEIASTMARDIIVKGFKENKEELTDGNRILKFTKEIIEKANTNIYLESSRHEEYEGMGTTITLAYIYKGYIYIGHVGDSRAYKINGGMNIIQQLTEDHSYINKLITKGDISKEEARTHPKRNLITRAVGSSSILEVDTLITDYNKGDILILSSDGLTNMISDDKMLEILKNNVSMQESCDELVKRANNYGGTDNITIVAIKID